MNARSNTSSLTVLSSLVVAGIVVAGVLSVACSGGDSASGAATPAPGTGADGGPVEPGPAVGADAGEGGLVLQNDAAAIDAAVDAPVDGSSPTCDGTLYPSDDPCVVVEAFGVFASTSLGNDGTGDGSRAKPYKTLGKAIAAAAAASKTRVYACTESYAESIVLVNGVSLFGNLDCKNGWALDPVHTATIAGKTSPTVSATSLATKLRVEGFAIQGPTASTPGASSIAVIASNVTDLTIATGSISAKSAASGAAGSTAPVAANAADIDGVVGRAGAVGCISPNQFACDALHAGVYGSVNVCSGVSGISGGPGGTGGDGGDMRYNGASWAAITPRTDGAAASALTAAGGNTVLPGTDGNDGTNGTNGASASKGTVTASGWVAGDGTSGTNGGPGQGGGGGGGISYPHSGITAAGDYFGYSGGGGGAGGCPGMAGGGGKGGGASIGLISWNSGVSLVSMTVTAANGGDGGAGSAGSGRQVGGAASPTNSYGGTRSGKGGAGGHSGWSGHGAGGSAIGVAYKGTAPDLGGAVPTVGAAGKGHALTTLDDGGFAKIIPAAADGISMPVWSIP